MADKREISKEEKQIIKDIMSRSNYDEEEASKIAKEMVDFGYTIHEQDYYKLEKIIWILKDHLGLYLVHQKIDDIEFYSVMSKILGMCLLNTNKNTYELFEEVL